MHPIALDAIHQEPPAARSCRRCGARRARSVEDRQDHPVIVAAGNTPEEQALPIKEAKTTIAFYGATPNYAFQFDDLGHTGLRDQLRDALKAGDSERSQGLITDEILDQFAVVARWDDVADRMIARYKGIAARLVIYLASHWREVDPKVLERWGEVARAVRKAA